MEERVESGRRAEAAAREFERAGRETGRAVRDARQKLSAAYERTSEAANRAYQEARQSAQDNPGLSALVCFGVGIAVGVWLAGTSRSRGLRSRIVPVLASAVADAVREIADEAR